MRRLWPSRIRMDLRPRHRVGRDRERDNVKHYRYIMDIPGGMAIADTNRRKVRLIIEEETEDHTFDEKRDLVRQMMVNGERVEMPGLEGWEK